MLDLGLAPEDRAAFEAALLVDHDIRVRVTTRDHNEDPTGSLTLPASRVLAGQVNVDTSGEVSRGLELTIIDDAHQLAWDASSPGAGAIFAGHFLSVEYGIHVEALGRWIDTPIFWGPVTKFDRTGAEVTLEAQGKESLGLAPHLAYTPMTIRKGTEVLTAIRRIMGALGETSYRMGAFSHRLPRPLSLTRSSQPWAAVQSLVRSAGRQAYYDGRGVLVVRTFPGTPAFEFTDRVVWGAEPHVSYELTDGFRNVIDALGPPPRGSKRHLHYVATLPDDDPLSPASLGRHGKPRRMLGFVKCPHARTLAQVKTAATLELGRKVREATSVEFEAAPIPHLEERDMVCLTHGEYSGLAFTADTFSIPLTADTAMSVGTTIQTRVRRA